MGGIPPHVRIGRRWINLLWAVPIAVVLVIVIVAVAKGLRDIPAVSRFVARNPGTIAPSPHPAYLGLPAWLRWQHFFNLFFMVFIIRSGVQILADHPRLYWTRHCTPGREWFRFQKPVPPDPMWTAKQDSVKLPGSIGLPGVRHTIGLARWWHLGTDMLFLFNGAVFYALLFATARTLGELAAELKHRGVATGIARSSHLVHQDLKHSGLLKHIGPDHLFTTVEAAVDALAKDA